MYGHLHVLHFILYLTVTASLYTHANKKATRIHLIVEKNTDMNMLCL